MRTRHVQGSKVTTVHGGQSGLGCIWRARIPRCPFGVAGVSYLYDPGAAIFGKCDPNAPERPMQREKKAAPAVLLALFTRRSSLLTPIRSDESTDRTPDLPIGCTIAKTVCLGDRNCLMRGYGLICLRVATAQVARYTILRSLFELSTMRCPHCRSDDVRRSESGNRRLPWVLRPVVVALRCNNCRHRFHVARRNLRPQQAVSSPETADDSSEGK